MQRSVVVIQSDDWGRTGLPDRGCLDNLRRAGLNVGRSPWDLYGLETEEDLEKLGASLERIRDRDGNPACITANFVMANADLRRMREQGYREFLWKSIDVGFPEPWADSLADVYRRLVARGVFYPGLHGFTHFNAPALMTSLRDSGPHGELARRLVENDIAYLASLTPKYNFALVDGTNGAERLRSAEAQAQWLRQGIDLFKRMFGFAPMTFCAPGYRADHITRRAAAKLGIRVVQCAGRQIPMLDHDCLLLVRNLAIEPVLDGGSNMPALMAAAHRAVVAGVPIIICTHSINYLTRFNNAADSAIDQFRELLERLLDRYPDLMFSDDARFEHDLKTAGRIPFGKPDAGQVAARLRYFATV